MRPVGCLKIWRMLSPFIGRELREQYAGSALGVVWSLLQPALYILLYWWVFAAIMHARLPENSVLADTPFIAFLLSALLPWFAFQDGLSRAASAVLNRRDVVCKVHFPVEVFPLAAAIAAFVAHGFGYVLFLATFALWRGGIPLTTLGAIAVLLALQLALTAGLGLLLGAVTVYLRDVAQALGLGLAVMFYTAPVLYPLSLVPERFHGLVQCNPFAVFAEAYHDAVLLGVWPAPTILALLVLLAGSALAAGAYVFRRLEPGFVDVL